MVVSLLQRLKKKWDGFRVGNDARRYARYLAEHHGIAMGNNVLIPPSCTIDLTRPFGITFGDNVRLTEEVTILSHDMDFWVLRETHSDPLVCHSYGRVDIGCNVYIGCRAIILKNVKIGNNCIIAAGAVVTRDTPDNTIAAGVPARVIKSLDQHYQDRKSGALDQLCHLYQDLKHNHTPPSPTAFHEGFPYFMDAEEAAAHFNIDRQLGGAGGAFRAGSSPRPFKTFGDFCRYADRFSSQDTPPAP